MKIIGGRREEFGISFQGSLANLDPALTINGTTVTPTFRYYLGQASAAGLPAAGYGVNLILGGAGADPTYNAGLWLPGDVGGVDDSCKFNAGKGFSGGKTATGLKDVVVELVIQNNSGNEYIIDNDAATNTGWRVRSGPTLVYLNISNSSNVNAALAAGLYAHVLFFVDRSGSAISYVNSAIGGSAIDVSALAATDLTRTLFWIGSAGAAFPFSGALAYAAAWESANWLDTHLQPTVAAERFYALTGFRPTRAKGTSLPVAARTGRAFDAFSDRVEADGTKKLYRVGNGILRSVSRKDSNGDIIKGYLAEAQATNLCLQSQTFDSASWTPARSSVFDGYEAPDGTSTAWALQEDDTAASTHLVTQSLSISDATVYVSSVWAKKGNRDWILLICSDGTDTYAAYFNLNAGTVGTEGQASGSIEDWGNGWYRCIISFTSLNTGTGYIRVFVAEGDVDVTFDGLDQDSIYLWGAQVETGNYPSSYIPTTTAARTRLADFLEYKGDDGNLGGVGSEKRGTIQCKVLLPDAEFTYQLFLSLTDGGSVADRMEIFADTVTGYLRTGTAATGGDAGSITAIDDSLSDGEIHEIKQTYQTDDMKIFVDGVSKGTDTDVDIPDDLDQITVASNYTSSVYQPNGVIADLKIFKTVI